MKKAVLTVFIGLNLLLFQNCAKSDLARPTGESINSAFAGADDVEVGMLNAEGFMVKSLNATSIVYEENLIQIVNGHVLNQRTGAQSKIEPQMHRELIWVLKNSALRVSGYDDICVYQGSTPPPLPGVQPERELGIEPARTLAGSPDLSDRPYATIMGRRQKFQLNRLGFGCGGVDLVDIKTMQRIGLEQILAEIFGRDGIEIPIVEDQTPIDWGGLYPRVAEISGSSASLLKIARVCRFRDMEPGTEQCVDFGTHLKEDKLVSLQKTLFDLLEGSAIHVRTPPENISCTLVVRLEEITLTTIEGRVISPGQPCSRGYEIENYGKIIEAFD